jgi:hypothetical protein
MSEALLKILAIFLCCDGLEWLMRRYPRRIP